MQDRSRRHASGSPDRELTSPLDRIVRQLRDSPLPADALKRALDNAQCPSRPASIWMRALLRGDATPN